MSRAMSNVAPNRSGLTLPSWLRKLLAHIQRRHYDGDLSSINHRDIQLDALALEVTHEKYWQKVDELESNHGDDETSHLMTKLTLARASLDIARCRAEFKNCARRSEVEV